MAKGDFPVFVETPLRSWHELRESHHHLIDYLLAGVGVDPATFLHESERLPNHNSDRSAAEAFEMVGKLLKPQRDDRKERSLFFMRDKGDTCFSLL